MVRWGLSLVVVVLLLGRAVDAKRVRNAAKALMRLLGNNSVEHFG